jgi:hypothetical protein
VFSSFYTLVFKVKNTRMEAMLVVVVVVVVVL